MLIFTESQSVDHSPKAEPEPEHKKKNVKKAMTVKSVKDEPAYDADTGKFSCFNFYKFVLNFEMYESIVATNSKLMINQLFSHREKEERSAQKHKWTSCN